MYQEGKDKTRISGLTLNMLGTPTKFHCKLKAMETMGFLEFLVYSVKRYRARVGRHAAVIIETGECLLSYVEIIQVAGANG